MRRILAYMDFLSPTGFSQVSENIFKRIEPFLEKYDIKLDVLAYNLREDEVQYSKRIKVKHPRLYAKNKQDPFYVDGFLAYLVKKPFDLVWIMNDFPLVAPFIPHLDMLNKLKKENKQPQFKSLLYFPVDSSIPGKYLKGLELFDSVVTYTWYGKRTLLDQIALAPEVNVSSQQINIIPHGIDTENFYRITDLDQRRALRDKYNLPQDTYIFGTVNKNGPRKDIGATLMAYAEFLKIEKAAENPRKTALYLHTYHSDRTGINIRMACDHLGLKENEDYFLPGKDFEEGKIENKQMNEIYNCFDCFISTSAGEGWGLTVTQAMACELPIICGRHTSFSELCTSSKVSGGHDLTYLVNKLHAEFVPGEFPTQPIRYKLDIPQTVELMRKAINNGNHVTYLSKIEEYNWDEIYKQWELLLSMLI